MHCSVEKIFRSYSRIGTKTKNFHTGWESFRPCWAGPRICPSLRSIFSTDPYRSRGLRHWSPDPKITISSRGCGSFLFPYQRSFIIKAKHFQTYLVSQLHFFSGVEIVHHFWDSVCMCHGMRCHSRQVQAYNYAPPPCREAIIGKPRGLYPQIVPQLSCQLW